jgi:hypothetical protein
MKAGHRDVKVYYVNSFMNMVKSVLPAPWRLWIKARKGADSEKMGATWSALRITAKLTMGAGGKEKGAG